MTAPSASAVTPKIGVVELEGMNPRARALWDALVAVMAPELPEPRDDVAHVYKDDLLRLLDIAAVGEDYEHASPADAFAVKRLCDAAGLS